MSSDLKLFHTINLDNFVVKIYCFNDESPTSLIADFIEPIMAKLNNEDYPRGVVERLESMQEFRKIEIYDKDNNLLLDSTKFDHGV